MTIPIAQVEQTKADPAAAQGSVATNTAMLVVGYTLCGHQLTLTLNCQRCGPTTQQSGSHTAKASFGYTTSELKLGDCVQAMSAAESDLVVDLMLNDSPAPNDFVDREVAHTAPTNLLCLI